MTYADFAYYSEVYGGMMAEGDFRRLSRAASAYLDALTFGRASTVTDERTREKLRDACCAVADCLHVEERGEVVSASNDGYSETYAASGRSAAQRRYDAAALYLANTGLLYAGCDCKGGCCSC